MPRRAKASPLVQASALRPEPKDGAMYVPSPELAAWASSTFIAEDAILCNPEHKHLRRAKIGYLWAHEENTRLGAKILGMAQLGAGSGGDVWSRGQREQQVKEWFGFRPDFIITIDSQYWEIADDGQACALLEHELYHCAVAKDKDGFPKMTRDGCPIWAMRGHDVEEFVGVVARYGIDATYLDALAHAITRGPTIGAASIARACGNCLGR